MDGASTSDDVGDGLRHPDIDNDVTEETNAQDVDGRSNNNDDDAGNGGVAVDVKAESLAEIVDADGESEKKKRPLDGGDATGSSSSNMAQNNTQMNKRQKRGRHEHSNSNSHHLLNESSTLDDISTMDATSYLAWVNQQAKALPNVFVATEDSNRDEANNDKNVHVSTEKSSSEANTKSNKTGENEEDVVHETVATVQLLLSKRMDILSPPTIQHLPPCQITTASSKRESSQPPHLGIDVGEPLAKDRAVNPSSCCQQWVSDTTSNFSKLRIHLEKEYAKQKQKQQQQSSQQQPMMNRKIAVPRMKDRAAWHIFCLGKEEAHGNVGGYYEDDDGDDACGGDSADNVKQLEDRKAGNMDAPSSSLPRGTDEETKAQPNENGPSPATIKPDSNNASLSNQQQQQQPSYDPSMVPTHGYPPTTSLLLQFDQVLTRMLFHHHVHYLCEWKFPLTQQRAMWIYALLARMEKPWHREECCAVRSVLRECCGRRAELKLVPLRYTPLANDNDGKEVATTASTCNADGEGGSKACSQLALLNTLIAIAGIYYEQGAHSGGDGMDSLFSVVSSQTR